MEEHPSPEKLRRFVAGELPQEEARKVMAHVLKGCHFCGEEASRYNFLRLSRASRPASAGAGTPQGRITVEERPSPAFARSTVSSKM